jgi:ribose transport system substrate-binding protein
MKLAQWLAVPMAALVLTGCVREAQQSGTGAPSPAPAAAVEGTLKIAVVPKGTTHEFWQTIKAGADAAGRDFDAQILWNGPKSETHVQDQIDIITNYASQGVHGIALAATDKNALARTVDELEQRGIPTVTIDSGIDPDRSRCFVATDNVAAARLAAQEMGRLLNGTGKVAVLSFFKGSGTSDEREQGFLEGIREFPGIEVAQVEYTDSDSAKARDKMETLLTAHPDLNGVFASNEPNVVGAGSVLRERRLSDRLTLVGFDASPSEIQYLEQGVVHALVVQDPFKMGYEGVRVLSEIARGKSVERRVDTGAVVVTRDNLNEPEIQKLLYPLGKK